MSKFKGFQRSSGISRRDCTSSSRQICSFLNCRFHTFVENWYLFDQIRERNQNQIKSSQSTDTITHISPFISYSTSNYPVCRNDDISLIRMWLNMFEVKVLSNRQILRGMRINFLCLEILDFNSQNIKVRPYQEWYPRKSIFCWYSDIGRYSSSWTGWGMGIERYLTFTQFMMAIEMKYWFWKSHHSSILNKECQITSLEIRNFLRGFHLLDSISNSSSSSKSNNSKVPWWSDYHPSNSLSPHVESAIMKLKHIFGEEIPFQSAYFGWS
jgi:hypothetical protein